MAFERRSPSVRPPRQTRPGSLARAAAIALMVVMVAGCDVLLRWASVDQGGDPDGTPTDFSHGRAAIQITSGDTRTIALDRLGNITFLASFDPRPPAGGQAEWMDASGVWLLTVLANTAPNPAFFGQQGTLWLQDGSGDPPLYADGSPCRITITEISSAGFVGTAECQGLRWLNDYEAQTLGPENAVPLADYAPFDAVIWFEARP